MSHVLIVPGFFVPFCFSISLLLGLAGVATHSKLMLVSLLSPLLAVAGYFKQEVICLLLVNSKFYLYQSHFYQIVAQKKK